MKNSTVAKVQFYKDLKIQADSPKCSLQGGLNFVRILVTAVEEKWTNKRKQRNTKQLVIGRKILQ